MIKAIKINWQKPNLTLTPGLKVTKISKMLNIIYKMLKLMYIMFNINRDLSKGETNSTLDRPPEKPLGLSREPSNFMKNIFFSKNLTHNFKFGNEDSS